MIVAKGKSVLNYNAVHTATYDPCMCASLRGLLLGLIAASYAYHDLP